MTHPVFELITPPGGPWARMSGFTNDLTNFWVFPALGAIIPIFWAGSPLTFKNKLNFMILDPDWAIFRSVTAQKRSKMRCLELPVNKALPTEISFWDFLYT